jgi:hypothetical protein
LLKSKEIIEGIGIAHRHPKIAASGQKCWIALKTCQASGRAQQGMPAKRKRETPLLCPPCDRTYVRLATGPDWRRLQPASGESSVSAWFTSELCKASFVSAKSGNQGATQGKPSRV